MEADNEEKESFKSWLISIGAFMMVLIILCPYRLSGLIYVVLIEAYQTDRKLAAMPIFMFVLMTSILGPITGLIGQKLGAEKTTLLGFLLAAIGFGSVFFADNIIVVIIFLGFVYGAGLTLGSTLIPNILKKHFSKNFNSANGIVRSGSCIGAFIFPPFAIYLFDTYGTAGTFLIVAGLMLNGIPVIMLIMMAGKKVKTSKKPQKNLLRDMSETNDLPNSKINNKIEEGVLTKDNDDASQIREASSSQTTASLKEKDFTKDSSIYCEKLKETTSFFNTECYEKDYPVSSSNITGLFTSVENIEIDKLEDYEVENISKTSYMESKMSNASHNIDSKQPKETLLFSSKLDRAKNSREDLSILVNNVFTNSDTNQNIDFEQSNETTSFSSTNSLRENSSYSSNSTFTNSDKNHIIDSKQRNEFTLLSSTNSTRDDLSISSNDTFTYSCASHNIDSGEWKRTTLLSSTSSSVEESSNSSNINYTNSDSSHNIDCEESKENTLFLSANIARKDLSISLNNYFINEEESQKINCDQSTENALLFPSKIGSEIAEDDLKVPPKIISTEFVSETTSELNNKENTDSTAENNFAVSRKNYDQSTGDNQSIETILLASNNDAKHTSNDSDLPSQNKKPTFCSSMEILINPIFLVLTVLQSLLSYNLTMVWTTLIDYSRDKGIPREYEVYILMFHPLFDFIGRVGLTWVVDRGYVGYTMFYMMGCLICALSVLGLILSSSFIMLITYAAMFALSTGAQLAIAPGLIIKFLEKEEHLMAMPSRNLLYAPLSFTSLPIIGYFRNELKSYDGVYYLVVGVCLISCAITPLANRFSKARKRRRVKSLEMEIIT